MPEPHSHSRSAKQTRKTKALSPARRIIGNSFRFARGPRIVFRSGKTVKSIVSESVAKASLAHDKPKRKNIAKTLAAKSISKEVRVSDKRGQIAAESIEQLLDLWPTKHRSRIDGKQAEKAFAVFEGLIERLQGEGAKGLEELSGKVRDARRASRQTGEGEFIAFYNMRLLEEAGKAIVSASLGNKKNSELFNKAFDEASFFIDKRIELKK